MKNHQIGSYTKQDVDLTYRLTKELAELQRRERRRKIMKRFLVSLFLIALGIALVKVLP